MDDVLQGFGKVDQPIGEVIADSGTQITVASAPDSGAERVARIGALVRIGADFSDVVAAVSTIQAEAASQRRHIFVADLLGELVPGEGGTRFRRGVGRHPVIGTPVYLLSDADRNVIHMPPSAAHIRIGTLSEDPTGPAVALSDDLLSKHFAVIGATGTGKSCALTLLLSQILAAHPNAHVVLLDPHNEYAAAFGELAEIVNVDNLRLPLWLFNFEEAAAILIRGTAEEKEAQGLILHDTMVQARREFGSDIDPAAITVDTPVPFGAAALLGLIEQEMGRFEHADRPASYLRLKARLEALRGDSRFAFMFADWLMTHDTLAEIVGRLLRLPVAGRPITIMDLSGVPSEVADVIVSLVCRLIFDFKQWAGRGQMPPVLLVCEEAHLYVPADITVGFAATKRAIGRIAKEGRKYGISLALVSQRPSELSPQAISQCGTVFALRLPADLDQRFVSAALPDAAHGLLTSLPSLGAQEAIVCGEGIALPMRIRFDDLPPDCRPRSASAKFSKDWQTDTLGIDFVHDRIRRWRLQSREPIRGG